MMTVPSLSILFMAVSALLSIGVPIGLLIYFHKKYGAKIVPALVGAAAFIVFAMGLEQVMHLLVLRPAADGTTTLTNHPVLYMLYGSFAAGIFEETARFLSFKWLRRKYKGIRTALSYGVGHGGIEAILIGGVSMIANLVFTILVMTGGIAAAQLSSSPQLAAQVQALSATPSYLFLVSSLERMLALVIQISLSVIVFYSVYESRRVWLYPVAIVLHALIDAPAALMQTGVFSNVFAMEGLVFVCAAVMACLAVYTHRRLKPTEEAPNPARNEGGAHEEV